PTSSLAGFTFRLYGQTYNTLFFSSNGLITFGSGTTSFTPADLTSSPTQATIAPFWDDLFISGASDSGVYWQVLGSGASQRLVIEWYHVSFFDGSPRAGGLTFEAVLGADGSVQFNYQSLSDATAGHDEGAAAAVGIKDAGT